MCPGRMVKVENFMFIRNRIHWLTLLKIVIKSVYWLVKLMTLRIVSYENDIRT